MQSGSTKFPEAGEDEVASNACGRDVTVFEDIEKQELPNLLHRFRHNSSILCLIASDERVYAGTQAGQLLVFTLDTYQREHVILAHHGSMLGLCLSEDKKLLFTSAGDRLIHVWSASTLEIIATIYSLYDVGDIFCVSYSSLRRTVYFGCQNTSIQWCDLASYRTQTSSDPESHPSLRQDRFFDSPGPGGIRNPRQRARSRSVVKEGARLLEIPKAQTHQFAHYGYVQCMLLAKGLGSLAADEETLITAGGDGAVCLWKLDSAEHGKPILSARLASERDDAASIQAIALEGNFLFTGSVDGDINVLDLETKQLVRSWNAFKGDVLSLTICSGQLCSTSDGGDAKLFNSQYECTKSWRAHTGRVLASVASGYQKQSLFITGGNDDSVAIWRLQSSGGRRATSQQQQEDELLESLANFISFRTVSSDPRYKADCRRGASYLRSLLRSLGATTEMISTEQQCNPIVFAKFRNVANPDTSGKRILFYGHYDVIAAENKQNLWIQDPFSMTGQDGFLYGRGASDNKGPVLAAIYAAADVARSKQLHSDIIFLIEGEEECGSRCFEDAIHKHRDIVGEVDCILVANSYWLDDEVPCLTYGLRGVLHATVHVESELPDLHSGVDGSRCLDEPLKDLVMLTSQLTGPKGVINVPGFDDCIRPITDREERLYEEVSQSLVWRNPKRGNARDLAESLKQRWREPSLTIHGFKTSGSEKSTIIPHAASVALSMRLVPNQESCFIAKSLQEFLQVEFEKLSSSNTFSVQIHHTAEPWLGDPTNDLFRTLGNAVKDVWTHNNKRRKSLTPLSPVINPSHIRHRSGAPANRRPSTLATSTTLALGSPALDQNNDTNVTRPVQNTTPSSTNAGSAKTSAAPTETSDWRPLYIREGGSIPAIRFLEKEFNAPAAQLPCGQASDNAHLDNERLRVVNLLNSREIFRRVFTELSNS